MPTIELRSGSPDLAFQTRLRSRLSAIAIRLPESGRSAFLPIPAIRPPLNSGSSVKALFK